MLVAAPVVVLVYVVAVVVTYLSGRRRYAG